MLRDIQFRMNTAKFSLIAVNFLRGIFDYWFRYLYAKLLGVSSEQAIVCCVTVLTNMSEQYEIWQPISLKIRFMYSGMFSLCSNAGTFSTSNNFN